MHDGPGPIGHHRVVSAPLEPRVGVDWELLRQFLAIADAGSLSKAAARLGVSQPTLTRQIATLEAALGIALFERTTRGVTPSEAARALIGPVREMHRQAQTVERVAQGHETSEGGLVRVSASEMIAAYVLPAILVEMRRALPDIDVRVLATDRVADLVEREADIALRMVRPTQPQLVARKVGELALGAFAHRDYIARRGEPRTLADLADHDLVGFDGNGALRDAFARAGTDVGALRFAGTSNSHVVSWQMVRAGLGVGFATRRIAMQDASLVSLLGDEPLPRLPIWMTVHQEVGASLRLRRAYDFLGEGLAALAVPP